MTRLVRLATIVLPTIVLVSACAAGNASASKQVIDYFGTEVQSGTHGGEFAGLGGVGDIAVNSSGAGPAGPGDIYVIDSANNRVQRFAQDDNGTPADPYDDSYPFVAAWGAGVETGGAGYEVCTVAANCQAGLASAGNGGLSSPQGVAVDQDTGQVYVSDTSNHRIVVYAGDGAFLRAFGFDVVASGPDDSGTGYEVCVTANGDLCKAGTSGSGVGQIAQGRAIAISAADGNAANGTIFVGDTLNTRVDTYALDGSAPASFGSSAQFHSTRVNAIAVDSRGIVYVGDFNNQQEIDRYDSQGANGGGIGFLASIPSPPLTIGNNNGTVGLEVDPDSDGVGPDSDVLHVLRTFAEEGGHVHSLVQQFGPVNAPGLTAPPSAVDDTHGALIGFNFTTGLGLDVSNGRLFVSSFANVGGDYNGGGPGTKSGVYVLDTAGGPPSAGIESIGSITPTSATIHATVNPNGGPPVSYRLEYSTDGTNWTSAPEALVGSQEAPQSIEAVLSPPGGLQPNTLYHVRLVATKAFTPSVVSTEKTFTTLTGTPEAETVGSPIRTATTARLEGRLNPRGSVTTYHFEYGAQGPCDANPCASTEPLAAGSGQAIEFVAQEVALLAPATTYHYRLIADSGNTAGPVLGEDMTVTTLTSDQPLSHGHFPGPAGSDRAWEQVNLPDTGGNPVVGGLSFSNDGEKAIYQIPGGTPITDSGSAFNLFFAERTASGWQSRQLLPARSETIGPNWLPPAGSGDLSSLLALNANVTTGQRAFWSLHPGGTPSKLVDIASEGYGGFFTSSDDGSRAVIGLKGNVDPVHPAPANTQNLYDISSGTPQLVSLLPDETVAACGVNGSVQLYGLPDVAARRPTHWLSADGSRLVFPSEGDDCSAETQLYLRDIRAAITIRISGSAVSGPICGAGFVKQAADAVFFWTQTQLLAEDSVPVNCTGDSGGDVYRYDLGDGTLSCPTCVVEGLDADVLVNKGSAEGAGANIGVAEDGSRLYFASPNRLLPGAATPGAYRVDVASGALAYVGPLGGGAVGDFWRNGNALNPDGSVLIFRSSNAGLNQLNGAQNGGSAQYYRYDDRDRSLTCVSCPPDGGEPAEAASEVLAFPSFTPEDGPNGDPLDDSGDTFVFATPNALVGADQNTPRSGGDPTLGTDVYEWRGGRVLLVSDGLTNWPNREIVPAPNGVSPSGRDVFFTASAAYTPDALDSYNRLYDARIGGGIDFPQLPQPCALEVCQGTPKGAPEEEPSGSRSYSGAGNVRPAAPSPDCPKGKRKVRRGGKVRCLKPRGKKHRHKAHHNRRIVR
jgi:hypothetical protein